MTFFCYLGQVDVDDTIPKWADTKLKLGDKNCLCVCVGGGVSKPVNKHHSKMPLNLTHPQSKQIKEQFLKLWDHSFLPNHQIFFNFGIRR